jgi:hypothetical protein
MYYRARRPQGLLMLWRRSTACTALVEGIRHSALCAVLIDGIALMYNPPLHNRRTIVERAEQGWQYSMVYALDPISQERHIPPNYVAEDAITQRKPPEVRLWTWRHRPRSPLAVPAGGAPCSAQRRHRWPRAPPARPCAAAAQEPREPVEFHGIMTLHKFSVS